MKKISILGIVILLSLSAASAEAANRRGQNQLRTVGLVSMGMIGIGLLPFLYDYMTSPTKPIVLEDTSPAVNETLGQKLLRERLGKEQPGDKKVIAALMQQLKSCSEAKGLLETIQAQGSISIKLGANVPSSGFWHSASRTVAIGRQLFPESYKLHWLLFELINASQDDVASDIVNRGLSGNLSLEEYQKSMLRMEHESSLRHSEIAAFCRDEAGWDPRIAEFYVNVLKKMGGIDKTFDEIWLQMQEVNQFHMSDLKMQWEKSGMKSRYCAKNPAASDCPRY